jgi:hypothetical protein
MCRQVVKKKLKNLGQRLLTSSGQVHLADNLRNSIAVVLREIGFP